MPHPVFHQGGEGGLADTSRQSCSVKMEDRLPASAPMGSSTPSAKSAASKNRLARAERIFKTPRASAFNCSAISHFVVVLLRFPFIAVLDFSLNHLNL